MFEFLTQELEFLKSIGLYRELKTIEKIDGSKIIIAGRKLINFCSNDYLGLSQHPKVKERTIEIIKEFGVGAGASRLISGNTIIHEELERKIAKFKKREAAIVFPTGYQANLGVISCLVEEKDTVIIDRLNHASIIDACRLSKAQMQVYPHQDLMRLENILQRSEKFRRRLIITDSVFSMDGDLAPLPEIIKLAKKYQALVMIDEAHATGVIGKTGRGLEEFFNIEGQADIVMGTFSKALGSIGGFVCGSLELITYLRNKARSFIYTTALPAAICAAALAALEIIENEPELINQLWKNINKVNPSAQSAIIPIIIGELNKTMEISTKFFENGIFLSGIRPPTVPKNQCRLRLTITAAHTENDLEHLRSLIRKLIKDFDLGSCN
ncbi:MAG: 8-amino-7-oxononanoate synthase [Candidatus Margulisiibacteriota bacterium]